MENVIEMGIEGLIHSQGSEHKKQNHNSNAKMRYTKSLQMVNLEQILMLRFMGVAWAHVWSRASV